MQVVEWLSGASMHIPPWEALLRLFAAVLAGAHIVRVHAVAEMVQVVRVAEEIRRHQP